MNEKGKCAKRIKLFDNGYEELDKRIEIFERDNCSDEIQEWRDWKMFFENIITAWDLDDNDRLLAIFRIRLDKDLSTFINNVKTFNEGIQMIDKFLYENSKTPIAIKQTEALTATQSRDISISNIQEKEPTKIWENGLYLDEFDIEGILYIFSLRKSFFF